LYSFFCYIVNHFIQTFSHKEGNVMKRMFLVCLLVLGLMLSWTLVYAGDFYVIPVKKSGTYDPPCFDNTNRYVACGNGTVQDTVTNLIWLKNANCFGTKDYAAANNAAAGLGDGDCGLTDGSSPGDWRLPTKEEWEVTVQRAVALICTSPSLTNTAGTACYSSGLQPFTNVQSGSYWSSTTYASSPDRAWRVYMGSGHVDSHFKVIPFYVWPVRSGN
jgi:hypothetical protein